jgi:hypothetical protein
MAIRTTHIDSNFATQVHDYDHSFVTKRAIGEESGVLFSNLTTKPEFDLNTWTGEIAMGECVIIWTRIVSQPIANQKMMLRVNLYEAETVSLTVWNKIYIEINDSLLQDPTLIEDPSGSSDYALGNNIAELKSTASYPTHPNYIKLWEVSAWPVYTDMRVGTRYSDDALNLPLNQDFIDVQTETTSNTNTINALTSWGIVAINFCWEAVQEGEQVYLEVRPPYSEIVGARFWEYQSPIQFTLTDATAYWRRMTQNQRHLLTGVRPMNNVTMGALPGTVYLMNSAGTNLATAAVTTSWGTGVFSYILEPATVYQIAYQWNGAYRRSLVTIDLNTDLWPFTVNYWIYFNGTNRVNEWTTMRNISWVNSYPIYYLWDVEANSKYSYKFLAWDDETINSVKLALSRQWSPTDNVLLRIETDNAWEPSWTLFDTNASWSIVWSTLNSVDKTDAKFLLDWDVSFVRWETYHITIERTGALNNTNYYIVHW